MHELNSGCLLICMGQSSMIVPQAVLSCSNHIKEVHVFTTDHQGLPSQVASLQQIFSDHFPQLMLTFTVPEGVSLLNSAKEQSTFEECLYAWFLEKAAEGYPQVCISGGSKTIPATMQQAARYFGAERVFHTVADMPRDQNPLTMEEVQLCHQEGKIRNVEMGFEPGWNSLRQMQRFGKKPLKVHDLTFPGITRLRFETEPVLARQIRHVMDTLRRVPEHTLSGNFPFPSLLLLPAEIQTWLAGPLDFEADRGWIEGLPKCELHCHLGGFATHGTSLEQVRASSSGTAIIDGPPPELPHDWPLPGKPVALQEYMRLGDANGSTLLKDPGCLRQQVVSLYDHFLQQNMLYAEVRCSPDNYACGERSARQVLQEIIDIFVECMQRQEAVGAPVCSVNLIVIVTRKTAGDLSSISRHIALAITASRERKKAGRHHCEVRGIDLAGFESEDTRAAYYAQDFLGAHRCGLAVTAHAGENDDAEGIWQAVYHLHARRLGHALSLLDAPDLLKTVADRKIGIEMCPYANYQIKGFKPMPGSSRQYPLKEYLTKGILVSVNTDNIGISAASLSDNLLLLTRLCPGITRMDVLLLQRNALETAFLEAEERKLLISRYDALLFQAMTDHRHFT